MPLNLTNLGTIWLSFISGETKIRIPNYTNAENVEMTNGEVVFRISEEEANRILALSNHTFYVSSAITDSNSSSDETVLFSGSWNEYSSAMRTSLTETIQSLNDTIATLKNKILTDTDAWNVKLSELEDENSKLKAEIDRLNAQTIELETKLAEIDSSYIDANIISENSVDRYVPTKPNENDKQDLEYKASKLSVISLKSTFTSIKQK